MTIRCPRCNKNVDINENHCSKCGFSIKNYIHNKKINVSLEVKQNENNEKYDNDILLTEQKMSNAIGNLGGLNEATKNKRSAEDIEDNIIRFIRNIRIVKDVNYNPEDDEIDSGMQAFLVEALNDTYRKKDNLTKDKDEYTLKKEDSNKKEQGKETEKQEIKVEAVNKKEQGREIEKQEIKVEEVNKKEQGRETEKQEIKVEEVNKKEQGIETEKQEIKVEEVNKKEQGKETEKQEINGEDDNNKEIFEKEYGIKNSDLKLQEPEEEQNLLLEDIFPIDGDDLDELVIGKIIEDSKSCEKFYNTINDLRQNKMNNKVIAMVTGTIVLVLFMLLLFTGVVTANEVR